MFCTRYCTEVTLLYKMYVVLPPCNEVSRPLGAKICSPRDNVQDKCSCTKCANDELA